MKHVLNHQTITMRADPTQLIQAIYPCRLRQRVLSVIADRKKKGMGRVLSGDAGHDLQVSTALVPVRLTIDRMAEAYLVEPHIHFEKVIDMLNMVVNVRDFVYALTRTHRDGALFKLELSKQQLAMIRNIVDFMNFVVEHHGDAINWYVKNEMKQGRLARPTIGRVADGVRDAKEFNMCTKPVDFDALLYRRNYGSLK